MPPLTNDLANPSRGPRKSIPFARLRNIRTTQRSPFNLTRRWIMWAPDLMRASERNSCHRSEYTPSCTAPSIRATQSAPQLLPQRLGSPDDESRAGARPPGRMERALRRAILAARISGDGARGPTGRYFSGVLKGIQLCRSSLVWPSAVASSIGVDSVRGRMSPGGPREADVVFVRSHAAKTSAAARWSTRVTSQLGEGALGARPA